MTQKVVLTQEQADAVESAKKRYGKDQFLYEFSRMLHEISPLQFTGSLGPINDLALHRVAKALYIGYEVEPSIKIGDFVDIGLFGISKITEVTGVKGNAIAINGSEEYHEFKINRVLTDEEKQEEKQRRWWAEHGRKVWELELLDKVRLSNVEYEVIEVCQKGVYKLQTNEYVPFHSIYVTNDQSKIGGKDGIELIEENNSKVVCFREDRKDV